MKAYGALRKRMEKLESCAKLRKTYLWETNPNYLLTERQTILENEFKNQRMETRSEVTFPNQCPLDTGIACF